MKIRCGPGRSPRQPWKQIARRNRQQTLLFISGKQKPENWGGNYSRSSKRQRRVGARRYAGWRAKWRERLRTGGCGWKDSTWQSLITFHWAFGRLAPWLELEVDFSVWNHARKRAHSSVRWNLKGLMIGNWTPETPSLGVTKTGHVYTLLQWEKFFFRRNVFCKRWNTQNVRLKLKENIFWKTRIRKKWQNLEIHLKTFFFCKFHIISPF